MHHTTYKGIFVFSKFERAIQSQSLQILYASVAQIELVELLFLLVGPLFSVEGKAQNTRKHSRCEAVCPVFFNAEVGFFDRVKSAAKRVGDDQFSHRALTQ